HCSSSYLWKVAKPEVAPGARAARARRTVPAPGPEPVPHREVGKPRTERGRATRAGGVTTLWQDTPPVRAPQGCRGTGAGPPPQKGCCGPPEIPIKGNTRRRGRLGLPVGQEAPVMHGLDLDAFRSTRLTRQPFDYLVVPGFIRPEARAAINRDYPRIDDPGSFPAAGLAFGPAFGALLGALTGPEVRAAFEEKFHIDLTGRPALVTRRGRCGTRDGHTHTDAASKLITALIYMNPRWEGPGGRLRLLRSADDLDDVLVEVPPTEGTLVAFRRSDNSFHGHKPFV